MVHVGTADEATLGVLHVCQDLGLLCCLVPREEHSSAGKIYLLKGISFLREQIIMLLRQMIMSIHAASLCSHSSRLCKLYIQLVHVLVAIALEVFFILF